MVDYCDIFSNIEFSPIYFDNNDKPDLCISNGQFYLFVVKDYMVILKRNKYVSSIANKNIMFVRFIVSNNLFYPIKLFYDGYIDVTSCTYFPNELVKCGDAICKDSNIYFILGMKEDFIKFKLIFSEIVNNYIMNNLSDILSPVGDYFLSRKVSYNSRLVKVNKINLRKLKIAYLDYYPNKDIICILSEYLLSIGFEVDLHGFDIKSYCKLDKSIYDIYLTLSVMLTEDKYDLSIYYISYLLDKDIDGFLDIINSENSNADYKKQNDYLLSHALCLPVCRGKFIYMKSKSADNFHISDKGLFKL